MPHSGGRRTSPNWLTVPGIPPGGSDDGDSHGPYWEGGYTETVFKPAEYLDRETAEI